MLAEILRLRSAQETLPHQMPCTWRDPCAERSRSIAPLNIQRQIQYTTLPHFSFFIFHFSFLFFLFSLFFFHSSNNASIVFIMINILLLPSSLIKPYRA